MSVFTLILGFCIYCLDIWTRIWIWIHVSNLTYMKSLSFFSKTWSQLIFKFVCLTCIRSIKYMRYEISRFDHANTVFLCQRITDPYIFKLEDYEKWDSQRAVLSQKWRTKGASTTDKELLVMTKSMCFWFYVFHILKYSN